MSPQTGVVRRRRMERWCLVEESSDLRDTAVASRSTAGARACATSIACAAEVLAELGKRDAARSGTDLQLPIST